MPFLSCLCCGLGRASSSQVSFTNPSSKALPDSNTWSSADRSPATRPASLKRTTTVSSRPIEENFELPKKSHSFPRTVTGGRRLSFKLSSDLTAPRSPPSRRHTVDPQHHPGDSLTGQTMRSPYERIYSIIYDGMQNPGDQGISSDQGGTLVSQSFGRGLLKHYNALLEEWEGGTPQLRAFIRDRAPQLFTMLVYTSNTRLLQQFCDKGIGDTMFPVKLGPGNPPSIEVMSTEGLPKKVEFDSELGIPTAMTLFGYFQWLFFAPELRWTSFEHSALDSRSMLPFLSFKEISRTEFSTVYQGVVHRDQISFEPDGLAIAKDKSGNPYVAVKQLQPNGLTRDAYTSFVKAEHETLEMLRGLETEHLIKATAFYKQEKRGGEDLYFIFPWAEHGNLRKFWKEKIPSICEDNYMKWVFEQLVGLADAILTLHHASDRVCRHGDLKPENVLCFNSSVSTPAKDHTSCVLVISDVGLARTHDKSTQFRSKTKMVAGETVAYAAPETELFPQRATSRRYDIWSFGCLCLEFIIWLLYGIEELERFGKEIGGSFYIITENRETLRVDGGKDAKVNPVVDQWIEYIKEDPRCTGTDRKETAIGRLVALVEKRLLVVAASPHPQDPETTLDGPGGRNRVRADSGQQANITPFQFNLRTATTLTTDAQNSQTPRFANAGADERAYALEVSNSIASIVHDAKSGRIDWVNLDLERTVTGAHHGPEITDGLTVTPRRDSMGRNQEYKFPKLDDKWEYIPDKDAAQKLRPILDQLPHHSEPSRLCGRCSNLPLWSQECSFNDTAAKLEKTAVRCALCQLLSRSLLDWATLPDDNLRFFRIGSSLKFNNKRLPPIASLYTLPASETDEALKTNIQLGFPKLSDPGDPTHIEVLREWIRDCNTHQCLHSQDEPFLPTRLLDVGKKDSQQPRLVCDISNLAKETNYLALSHRWGSPPNPGDPNPLADKIVCTYEKNIKRLQQGINDSDLPPLYQDAITIARGLNVQYIWIDSLCIIQHDKSDPSDKDQGRDFKKESERMERVFRSAYATIAASCADSPAEHFLRARPEREHVTMLTGNASYYVCDAIDDFYGDVEQGELNKRGWVLQERALSRRTIYFTEKQTYWECGEGVRCETLTKTRNSKASFLGDANFPHSFPDYVKGMKIKLYQDLYERYSKLALSYPTDRPVAIRGLETRLLRALDTKGGYGVFDMYLRRGLLWQRDHAALERIEFPDKARNTVPSWSWMAYAGAIRYMNVPLGGADWVQWDRDVVSPWQDGNATTTTELKVLVRDIAVVEPGARVFLDEPGRTFDRSFKCVVVGSSKGKGSQTYYSLIVTALDDTAGEEGEKNVYERAGVAFLNKGNIVWSTPGTEARVC